MRITRNIPIKQVNISPSAMVTRPFEIASAQADARPAGSLPGRNGQQGVWYNPIVLNDDDYRAVSKPQNHVRDGETKSKPIYIEEDDGDEVHQDWSRGGAKSAIASGSADIIDLTEAGTYGENQCVPRRVPSSSKGTKSGQSSPGAAPRAHPPAHGLWRTAHQQHNHRSADRHSHHSHHPQTGAEHFCDDCMTGIEFHG